MPTRRTLLGSALAAPLIWKTALAQGARDVAVMAMQIDGMTSLDPAESDDPVGIEIGANCYQCLTDTDLTDPTKLIGVLASHWEVAGDGLTYTLYLQRDRKFASGNLVTADDVAWSLQRVAILGKAPSFILTQFGFDKDNVAARIKATDDHTVIMQIAEANAPNFVLSCLAANVCSIIDKKVALSHAQANDLGNDWLRTASAGSNTWVVRSSKPDSVALDAAAAAAGPKRMVIRHVAGPAEQWLLLQKGEADIARNLTAKQLAAVAGKPDFKIASKAQGTLHYIALNQAVAELSHPDIAQAVKWAIDYDAIEKRLTPDLFKRHQAFLPEGIPGALTDNPFHKDLDQAKSLMKQGGMEKGFAVSLDHPASPPFTEVAQAIQADLAEIGIQVQLLPGDLRQVIAKTHARQHQMAMLQWSSDTMDPHSNAQAFCINTDNSVKAVMRTIAWQSGWQDMDLTGRAMDGVREVDTAKRAAQYEQLQKDFMQRAPFVIFQQQVGVAVMRKTVGGFDLGVLPGGTRFVNLAKA